MIEIKQLKAADKLHSYATLTPIFRGKKMKIALLIAVLPPFPMNTGIWKHWLEKTRNMDRLAGLN